MSDEDGSDILDSVAQAIALGEPVAWDDRVRECSPDDSAMLAALQGLQRIASAHHRILEAPAPEFVRWAHLTILERSERRDSSVRCRARDALGMQVGLLLIGPLHGDTGAVSELLKLARLATTIHHPNLATAHGADYALDYVGLWYGDEPGDTLEVLKSSGTISDAAAAAEIVRDVARAEHAIHSAGIVHNDVTPRTIKRTSDGRVVLLPSIALSGDPEYDVAALRQVFGYLAPSIPAAMQREIVRATNAAALAAVLERSFRKPWWAGEWLIGFLLVVMLAALIAWLLA